jgi:hypothetical protein
MLRLSNIKIQKTGLKLASLLKFLPASDLGVGPSRCAADFMKLA